MKEKAEIGDDEVIARNVTAVAYAGQSTCGDNDNSTNVLKIIGGADTVSIDLLGRGSGANSVCSPCLLYRCSF